MGQNGEKRKEELLKSDNKREKKKDVWKKNGGK
jgi:hypothetical protein